MMKKDRLELYRSLPLGSPLAVHIYPSFYCNFRCNYCLQRLSEEVLGQMGFQRQMMKDEIYRKAIDDLAGFEERPRALIFAGHGEPLTHPRIAEMVACAKEKKAADRVEIVTNASLLTHELSDRLIHAGLDRLRVSVQGTRGRTYEEVAGVQLDFEPFVDRLRYFYSHKTSTEVYVKIIDSAMEEGVGEEQFRTVFSGTADILAVEHMIPFVKEIDYSKVGSVSGKCKQGNTGSSRLCSMPFYMLVVNPDGGVAPCCSTEMPIEFGNIQNQSLKEIWDSEKRREFLLEQLNGYQTVPACRECSVPSYGLQEGDYLDGHEEELKALYRQEKEAYR